jgi:hypothetical protein
MRKTVLRRLEALEKEHRYREEQELSSLENARMYICIIVLAYYLGGLKSEQSPWEAHSRALKYPSDEDFSKALSNGDGSIMRRYNAAYRRLFAKVGLDFDNAPRSALFDAFVTMINALPDEWLDWLRYNLQQWCPHAEIGVGSNLPRRLSKDNFLWQVETLA